MGHDRQRNKRLPTPLLTHVRSSHRPTTRSRRPRNRRRRPLITRNRAQPKQPPRYDRQPRAARPREIRRWRVFLPVMVEKRATDEAPSLPSVANALQNAMLKAMTQLVTRVSDDLVASVDELVASGVVESRSDAVRRGLERLVDRHRRAAIGAAIAAGYQRQPQNESELGWSDASTIAMIAEEPW